MWRPDALCAVTGFLVDNFFPILYASIG